MPVTPVGAATPATTAATVPGRATLTFQARSSTSTIVDVTYRAPGGAGVTVTVGTATKRIQVDPGGTKVVHEVSFAAVGGGALPDLFIVEATVTEDGTFCFTRRWTIDVVPAAKKPASTIAKRVAPRTTRAVTKKSGAAVRKATTKKPRPTKAAPKKAAPRKAAPKKGSTGRTPRAAKRRTDG